MKRLLIVAAVACLALLTVSATQAKGPGGNSANAKLCYKGGWDNLYTRSGDDFDNERQCTSYAAQKGSQLINESALACLNGGWESLGTTSNPSDDFATEQACVDFAVGGGTPVSTDTTPPSVTINQALGQADPTSSSPINFIVVFDEAVSGFDSSDVALLGTAGATTAVVTEIAPNNATTYNVAVSGMTTSGSVIPVIPANVATDADNLGNTASTSIDNTVSYNAAPPSVTINQALGQADPTSSSPINFIVVFDEAVSGFDSSDVALLGTAGATTAVVTEIAPNNATTYNVAVSGMTTSGSVIPVIPANVATDADNLGNTASTSIDNTVSYNAAPPSVTINQALGQADPTSSSPINFIVVFDEAVSGFDSSDVALLGTAGATTAVVTEIAPNNATTYNVAVSGMTTSGSVIPVIPANVATDADNLGNTASTSIDNTVSYNAAPPSVTINQALGQADPTSSSPINFIVVFDEAVSGFDSSDVALLGTAGATTAVVTEIAPNNATTYNVAVSGMTTSGSVIPVIPANVATDADNLGNTASTSIDNTVSYNAT